MGEAMRQTLLLYTTDMTRATREIVVNEGAVTIRLSEVVFVASMPSTFRKESLERSSLIPPNQLDDVSLTMLTAWQAVLDRDLLTPTNPRRRLVSLDRRGIAAVAVVMETDISSFVFPIVLAGAHALAETYAGEQFERRRLTFAFKKFEVDSSDGIDGGQNVPSQVGEPPATKPVPSIYLVAWPSAVLSFNNKLYCFYQGHNADSGSLFYNEYDGSSWTERRQVPGVNTSAGPSAVVFNNKLYCFKQGRQGSHDVWYASFDGNQWEPSLQVPNTRITAGPSVLVFDNKLYCFHQGWMNPDHALWLNVFDGEKWAGDAQIEESLITASPAAVVFKSMIYCFYQGAGSLYENRLMVRVLNRATGLWSEQKVVLNSERMSQGPSAIVVDDKLYCFHQAESGGHLYANVSSDGVEWGTDTLIEDVSLCEGLATAYFNNELYYFFQKGEGGKVADGEMWFRKLKLAAPNAGGGGGSEPSLEGLGFEAGYKGFKELVTHMVDTTDSASYGYVVYITQSTLLYDAYADDIRMCLQFREPSFIHHNFASMFAVQATYDQRSLIDGANFLLHLSLQKSPGGKGHNDQRLAVSIWDEEKRMLEQAQSLNAETDHTLFGEPTAVVHKGFVYVFYVSGPGPSIWWNRLDDGGEWTGPNRVSMAHSGVTPTDEGLAASFVWDDKIHYFFRGRLRAPDGLLVFYKVFNPLDSTWNDEVILPTASGFSGKPRVILNQS